VTVVTVAYNSQNVLGKMLASLPVTCPKIVVDNASSDTLEQEKICSSHGVTYIRNKNNIGFGGACNLGASKAETEFLFFLYHEDDDLSLRLAELGPLIACAEAHIRHAEGHSSPRTPAIAALKAYHMARSRTYLFKKYGHSFAAPATIIRATLALLSPLNLSPRKAAKSFGFLRGALSCLADGGRSNGSTS